MCGKQAFGLRLRPRHLCDDDNNTMQDLGKMSCMGFNEKWIKAIQAVWLKKCHIHKK